MNYIFIFLILISFICATINNRMDIVVDEMLKSSQRAVEISFALIGIMGFWLGIINIAKKLPIKKVIIIDNTNFLILIFKLSPINIITFDINNC